MFNVYNAYQPPRSSFEMVQEFIKAFKRPTVPLHIQPSPELLNLLRSLIEEECCEVVEAFAKVKLCASIENQVELLDGLVDLKYVVNFAAATLQMPIPEADLEVHTNNMSKLDENGEPIIREDGKILKPPGYKPVNLWPILVAARNAQKDADVGGPEI